MIVTVVQKFANATLEINTQLTVKHYKENGQNICETFNLKNFIKVVRVAFTNLPNHHQF